MHNLTIKKSPTIRADFSADQWELFTMSFPRDEIESIANRLNNELEDYVNNGYTKTETLSGMHDLMKKFSKYGAYDSEPMRFLERVLEEIYR